jgi:hypothetical protein
LPEELIPPPFSEVTMIHVVAVITSGVLADRHAIFERSRRRHA